MFFRNLSTFAFAYYVFFSTVFAYEVFNHVQPSQCNSSSYFDPLSHNCRNCSFLNIPSVDHLSCQCRKGYHLAFNAEEKSKHCLPCESVGHSICTLASLSCNAYDIKVLFLDGNKTTGRCITCPFWSQPDVERSSCVSCTTACRCPENYYDLDGTCVKNGNELNFPDAPSMFTFQYHGRYLVSGFFRDRSRLIFSKCKENGYGPSCEQLANLCVLIDYNFDAMTVCSLYRQLAGSQPLPTIYYDEGRNFHLLDTERIPLLTEQKELQFIVKRYGFDGTYKGVEALTDVFPSGCYAGRWPTRTQINANARYSCKLSHIAGLLADRMHFFELFLVDVQRFGNNRLINVPLRVMNFIRAGLQRNKDHDIYRWQLTKRFFNIDTITGQNDDFTTSSSERNITTGLIRYLSMLHIRISLVPGQGSVQLRVPYATIHYNTVDLESDQDVSIRFLIEYAIDMDDAMKSLEITLSVLSAFAAVHAVFRTWVWYRRSAQVTVELQTLIQFLLHAADTLANVILLVTFLATFYWWVTFRQQHEVTVTPPGNADQKLIKDLIVGAFVLKTVSILSMICTQCSIDVFMIDWEKPRPSKIDAVSVWRMFFVTNEWNEMQVTRKSCVSLQITLVLLILKVFKLEVFALEVPTAGFNTEDDSLEFNCLLRYALGVTTYLAVLTLQILFNRLIYEPYVENKIQQFIDLCTLSNISVWLLTEKRYGFYIHGRSPHGFADTDMQTMCQQLKKEEDNLCAQRGLVQGQDGQTFTLSLHSGWVECRRRLSVPSVNSGNQMTIKSTYEAVNMFLSSFLDHALSSVDYQVRDRQYFEKILNCEFYQPKDRTIFYNDGIYAFDEVLFYGNEMTLASFDVLLFSLVDIYCQDYVMAGVATFLIYKILQFMRYRLGRRNLAQKTLIDARFLF